MPMTKAEAKRLVWEWLAVQMDHATMSWDITDLLLAEREDEVQDADTIIKLNEAWKQMRARVGKLAGEEP